MPWASPAPMLEQFVGTFTKPGAKRVDKMKLVKKKIDIVNDYRLRWRDTVRKGKYQNGAGWLTSLGQDDMKFFIDEGRKLVDDCPKANLDGYFSSPLRLVHSKKDNSNSNFPQGISPRLINIVDYITANSKKWESGWMKHFSYSYPKGFEDDCFHNRTDDRQCGLYEVFRVITTDNDNAYCIRQLYSMGVGLKSVLSLSHRKTIDAGGGYNYHPEATISDICNLHILETETISSRSNPFIYPGLIQTNTRFQKLKEKMMGEFPLEDFEEENLSEGQDLFAIPLNMITMKTGDMSPIAIRKQKVNFGDYVCLLGDIESEGYEIGVSTKQRVDRRVHDVVFSPTRDSGFIHLSQMDGAFGTNTKTILQEEARFLALYSKEAIERERLATGNLPSKMTRVMENMTAEEMVSMMTGISVADAEGMDIGKTTEDITDPNSPVKTEFVPTWKDNRKTIEIRKGSAFSDYVRCYVCNQKYLISLPANNKIEEMECTVCPATDGLKVGHLVEGNPGIVVSGSRPYR